MGKNKELIVYQSILDQQLSIRAAARMLNIPKSTMFRRMCKFKSTGNLVHGNTGHANRKSRPDKQYIIELANTKYADFGMSHICGLLESRDPT